MIDRRVSDAMARSHNVRCTWNQALAALDLAEMNARYGGRFSWGRLRAVEVKEK